MTNSESLNYAAYVILSNAMAITLRYLSNKRKSFYKIGTVDKLCIYPVKSCRGLEFSEADCDYHGLVASNFLKDRHFAIVIKSKTGDPAQVLTQRKCPRMALVRLEIVNYEATTFLRFAAPDMPNLDIQLPFRHQSSNDTSSVIAAKLWGQIIHGKDCGPNVAHWWQIFLGRDDITVMHAESGDHLKNVEWSDDMPMSVSDRLPRGEKTAYADWAPLLVVNDRSVEELNSKIMKDLTSEEKAAYKKITYRNFRPNVLINTSKAFDEDQYDRIYLVPRHSDMADVLQLEEMQMTQIAAVVVKNIKHCTRCVLTTVDPDIGEKRSDSQPLKALKQFRISEEYGTSPLFGINGLVDKKGVIKTGYFVYVSYLNA